MLRIEVKGTEELQNLAPSLRSLISLAVREAARAYVESVINYVERERPWTPRTGNLLQSVTWFPVDEFSVQVTGESDHLKYGRFLELGTKGPYVIKPRKRKALKIPTQEGYIIRKKATHPGIKPRPWFFVQIHRQVAREAFTRTIQEGLK